MPSFADELRNAVYVLTTSPTPHLPDDQRFPSDASFSDYCAGYWMALVTALRALDAAVERRRLRGESQDNAANRVHLDEQVRLVKPRMARAGLAPRRKVS